MSLMNRLLMFASLIGIVAFFLPFAYDTSPFQAIHSADVWWLGVPFLVPFVAVWLRTTEMHRGTVGQGLRRFVYGWSVATLLVTLSLYVALVRDWPSAPGEWILFFIPLAGLIAGGVIWRRDRDTAELERWRPFLALRLAYLPNAAFCLAAFGNRNAGVGAYLVLATTLIYAADVARSGRD